MGEVYRARDTRLGRDVALKVLSDDLAHNEDRRARFEKEARAVAALNHPNIVSLYDVGNDGGVFYTVSEVVEGESLRAVIRRGPVPIRKLLDIAVQLAEGMAAAHAARITHRDLKPENVMMASDGRIKILDFGLARQAPMPSVAGEGTVTVHQTEPGAIMGTVNYMSPEQARGIAVDYRSDQFSFGLILYELASGTRAFEKESTVQTMSAIITEEPPPVAAKIPAPLRWVIDRCLAKEPQQRYESTRDLYQDLRSLRDHLSDAFTEASESGLPAAPKPPTPRRFWKLAAIVSTTLLLAAVALGWRFRERNPDIARYRFTPFAIEPAAQGGPCWSPDGKAVAYSGRVNGELQTFLRYLNSPVATQLTNMPGGLQPKSWYPDGKRIFLTGKIPSSSDSASAIFSIAAVGGEPEELMRVGFVIASTISPDGKTLAALRNESDNVTTVSISSPIGAPFKRYSPDPFATKDVFDSPMLRFSPDGRKFLLILRGDTKRTEAWLIPYPAGNGPPHRVMQNVSLTSQVASVSWMPDSRRVLMSFRKVSASPAHLWIADTESDELRPLTAGTSADHDPAISPDGQKIVYAARTDDLDIVSVSLDGENIRKLITTERIESMPAWAAHSSRLVYVSERNGPPEIWLRGEDGTDRPIVTAADFSDSSANWMAPVLSPDGSRVAYTRGEASGAVRLWISPLSGGAPARLTDSRDAVELPGSWSPDGKRFVYSEIAGGKFQLMVAKVGSLEPPAVLHRDTIPNVSDWSPTGEWITFTDRSGWNLISPDGKTMRQVGDINTPFLMFSRDGKKLFGIRDDPGHDYLFSFDLATNQVSTIKDLGKDMRPASFLNPAIRFTLSPDSKSFTYAVATNKSNLWMLEGFAR
jgi:Tol biopolymer transport system component